jgi:hypothetical protein
MTRRQPSEPHPAATATDYRRLAYDIWPEHNVTADNVMLLAWCLESKEPIAHQPAGTVGITDLLKGVD